MELLDERKQAILEGIKAQMDGEYERTGQCWEARFNTSLGVVMMSLYLEAKGHPAYLEYTAKVETIAGRVGESDESEALLYELVDLVCDIQDCFGFEINWVE